MEIESFQLKTNTPKETIKFYTEFLGMTVGQVHDHHDSTVYRLNYHDSRYALELIYDKKTSLPPYIQDSKDNYWKYSLFVDDIQRVYQNLLSLKHPIKEPYQFGEIGYLAHSADVENYQIEFIQKYFKENTQQTTPETNYPLGESPVLGLLTIRTKDPVKIIQFYEEICEMKLLVRMYVDRGNGFTLYFLGDKELIPPSPDIDDVSNREWMYQQDHLFIEIQYYWGSEYDQAFRLSIADDSDMGLSCIKFKGDLPDLKHRLNIRSIPFDEVEHADILQKEIHIRTVDNHKIIVT